MREWGTRWLFSHTNPILNNLKGNLEALRILDKAIKLFFGSK